MVEIIEKESPSQSSTPPSGSSTNVAGSEIPKKQKVSSASLSSKLRISITNLALQLLRRLIPPLPLPHLKDYSIELFDLPCSDPTFHVDEDFLNSLFPELGFKPQEERKVERQYPYSTKLHTVEEPPHHLKIDKLDNNNVLPLLNVLHKKQVKKPNANELKRLSLDCIVEVGTRQTGEAGLIVYDRYKPTQPQHARRRSV